MTVSNNLSDSQETNHPIELTLKEVMENFINEEASVPSLYQFIQGKYIDIVSSATLYPDWSGLASAMIQQFIQVISNKHGTKVQVNTTVVQDSWLTLHKAIKARVIHKNGSLDLIASAGDENTSELDKTFSSSHKQQLKRNFENERQAESSKRSRSNNVFIMDNGKKVYIEGSSTPKQELEWSSEYENEFWDYWYDLLQNTRYEHDYDLQRYNVIECGYKITCKPNIPISLYGQLLFCKHSSSIVPDNSEYIASCIKSRKGGVDLFINATSKTQGPASTTNKVVLSTFKIFANHVFLKASHDIQKYETTYNYRVIWPLIDIAVESTVDNQLFKALPGEIRLKAFADLSSEYNADGLVLLEDKEILLLETSGPHNNKDSPRHAYDHVKGTFGLMAMFRAFVLKYHHGDINILHKLQLWFIHARDDGVHLWSLQMPNNKNMFILERVAKAVVPVDVKDAYYISSLIELFWQLKLGLDETKRTLDALEESHDEYMEMALGNNIPEGQKRPDLRKIIATKVVKPVRKEGYGPLLPKSFEFSSSS